MNTAFKFEALVPSEMEQVCGGKVVNTTTTATTTSTTVEDDGTNTTTTTTAFLCINEHLSHTTNS